MTQAQFKLEAYDYRTNTYHTDYVPFTEDRINDRKVAHNAACKMADHLQLRVVVQKPFMLGYVTDQTFGDFGGIIPNQKRRSCR